MTELEQCKEFIILKFGNETYKCLSLAKEYFSGCYFAVDCYLDRSSAAEYIAVFLPTGPKNIRVRFCNEPWNHMWIKDNCHNICVNVFRAYLIELKLTEIIEK